MLNGETEHINSSYERSHRDYNEGTYVGDGGVIP